MRGTHADIFDVGFKHGIIPAYAGNTRYETCCTAEIGDHPRVCGEHSRLRFAPWCGLGSSPRMRGTLGPTISHCRTSGIIPAYAGNTQTGLARNWWCGDHPRVCGEHGMKCLKPRTPPGSSPRMRGTHFTVTLAAPAPGIIPAYAGNTGGSVPSPTVKGDHPRVCGEHLPSDSG